MSKYFTQFDEDTQTIGTNLVGWTTRGTAAPTSYAPAYGTPPVKRRYINFVGNTSGVPFRNVVTWNAIDADANRANVELVGGFAKDAVTATDLTLAVRGVGASGVAATEGYMARLDMSGNIAIWRRTGAFTVTTIATAAFTFSAGKSYFVRFRVNGSNFNLRVWDAALGMAGEPAAWNITTTDATYSSAGWVGLGGGDFISGTALIAPWNFLSVATNGDTADCPRTNAEFLAWIEQPNQRCILAEMMATGYDNSASPFTKTVRAYVANMGFVSQQQDTPANQPYEACITSLPTFSRQMAADFAGPVSVGFGDLVISNPASGSGGLRDDWLRIRWSRNYLKMWIGDPSWPRHDFREWMIGRLGQPTAQAMDKIRFPVADLSDALNVPLVTARFTFGTMVNQTKAKIVGRPSVVEILPHPATLLCTVNDGAIFAGSNWNNFSDRVLYDFTGVSFSHIGNQFTDTTTISAANAGTDVLTTSASHGFQPGWRIVFTATAPDGLTTFTAYWVLAAGLTATNFKLTATQGSLTSVDITGATSGMKYFSHGYSADMANGTIQLISPPAGRVFIYELGDDTFNTYVTDVLSRMADASGLSANLRDTANFAAAKVVDATYVAIAGYATQQGASATCIEAMTEIAIKCQAWFGFSPDGLLQTGKVGAPATSAIKSLTASNVTAGTLHLSTVLRAIDFSKAVVRFGKWFMSGAAIVSPPINNSFFDSAYIAAGGYTEAATVYGAGTPLDNYPNASDSRQTDDFETLFAVGASDTSRRLKELRKQPLGIFEFQTTLAALWHANGPLSIGDTVSLDHPRLGWKNYLGSDDPSPDNTADYDARLAVVMGIDVNLSAGSGQQVTLKLYRPIVGYYPIANLN